jgi:hypothetical protein
MTSLCRLALTLAVAIPPTILTAQADARAAGWQLRPDEGHTDLTGFSFVEMRPGWHLTTGRFSGIVFHPERTGVGTYEAVATIAQFPVSPQRLEGYGSFVGGKDLIGPTQEYTYFLIRHDGRYLIKVRRGTSTTTLTDWTPSSAIRTLPADAAASTSVSNTLTVRVAADSVSFLINGTQVARVASAGLPLTGVAGIRANHGVNLHVSDLSLATPGRPAS